MSRHQFTRPPRCLNDLVAYLAAHPRVRVEADRVRQDVTFQGRAGNVLWFAADDGSRRGVRLFDPGYYETGLEFFADSFLWTRGPCVRAFWYLRDPEGQGGASC